MVKKKFKTREEFLQDNLNYFWGKPEHQCKEGKGCFYSPKRESEGCAIGRHLSLKLANKLDVEQETGVVNDNIFNHLPKWMQALGHDFLVEMQALHDTGIFVEKKKIVVNCKMKSFVDMSKITFPE
jgi:hypothetical protein